MTRPTIRAQARQGEADPLTLTLAELRRALGAAALAQADEATALYDADEPDDSRYHNGIAEGLRRARVMVEQLLDAHVESLLKEE